MASLKSSILKFATLNAVGAAVYVAFVATFMSHTAEIFNGVKEKNSAHSVRDASLAHPLRDRDRLVGLG